MWKDECGKMNSAQISLKYCADVNARNKHGQTALDWAAKGNYKHIVQLLFNKQADHSIKNINGKTPI